MCPAFADPAGDAFCRLKSPERERKRGKSMNIVVLCGGLSPERDVSISTGTKMAAALRSLGHKVILVDMFFGLENYEGSLENIFDVYTGEGQTAISETAPDLDAVRRSRKKGGKSQFGDRVLELCSLADLVVIGLHGQCGEDGKVQAAFDLLGIPYTGAGFLSSAVAMDKDLTKRIVTSVGVRTPVWKTYDMQSVTAEEILKDLALPLVIKPGDSGSSIGVAIVHTEEELRAALEEARKESRLLVVEEYIPGREIQVGILDGKALPSIEIRPKGGFYDYKNKYQAGVAEEITPAPIAPEREEEVEQIALQVYRVLRLQAYSRADFILDEEGKFWFLEINTLPGMTPTSLVPQEAAVVGYSYEDLCAEIVRASLRKYDE